MDRLRNGLLSENEYAGALVFLKELIIIKKRTPFEERVLRYMMCICERYEKQNFGIKPEAGQTRETKPRHSKLKNASAKNL